MSLRRLSYIYEDPYYDKNLKHAKLCNVLKAFRALMENEEELEKNEDEIISNELITSIRSLVKHCCGNDDFIIDVLSDKWNRLQDSSQKSNYMRKKTFWIEYIEQACEDSLEKIIYI